MIILLYGYIIDNIKISESTSKRLLGEIKFLMPETIIKTQNFTSLLKLLEMYHDG